MLELKLEIKDADPSYVESKVGARLYVHMRAVPAIAAFRRRALERAHALYEAGDDGNEGRLGALGLLVLQRAMLAVEDLGGLLYAVEAASFERLLSYRLEDISELFVRLFSDASATPAVYGLATAEAIDAEPGLSSAERRALKRLAAITQMNLDAELARVHHFWRDTHAEAKKTMHAVTFLEGRYVIDAPGAGVVNQFVSSDQERPFAVPLTTRVDHRTNVVNTEVGTLSLTRTAVATFRDAGLAACFASEMLISARLHQIATNHAVTVPMVFLTRLDDEDRRTLEDMQSGIP
jgi:hypothetical protein